jgi:hypothetical protein
MIRQLGIHGSVNGLLILIRCFGSEWHVNPKAPEGPRPFTHTPGEDNEP